MYIVFFLYSVCINYDILVSNGHTGAHLGSLLTARLITLGWLIPKPEKEFELTEIGRLELTNLGLNFDELDHM